MAPDYTDVKNANLSKLSTAVDAWITLPGKFKQVGTTFRTEVSKGLRHSNWGGEAAEEAFKKLDDVEKRITDAAMEASAVHDLLSSVV